jgi:hypothetical protein
VGKQSGVDITLNRDKPVGTTMQLFGTEENVDVALSNLQIKIPDTKTVIDKMWLLERYILT